MDMLVMATQLTTSERDLLMLSQKLSQKQILSTMELMDMDMLDIHMPTTHTQLTIMERDLLMLNQKQNQKLIHTTLPTIDMDIHMPIIHILLTIMERDLLMLRLNQKLIHTMLPTTDMLDIHMLVVTMVIHMELITLESKSKTEKRSKD